MPHSQDPVLVQSPFKTVQNGHLFKGVFNLFNNKLLSQSIQKAFFGHIIRQQIMALSNFGKFHNQALIIVFINFMNDITFMFHYSQIRAINKEISQLAKLIHVFGG